MSKDLLLLKEYAATKSAEAFHEIVKQHSAMVFSTSLRITGSTHDAEEVAQDCFLALTQKATTIESSPAGWLHASAKTRSLNLKEKIAKQKHREVTAMQESSTDESSLSWDDVSPYIDEAITELSDELRIPLLLHYLEGRTQEEVATELDVNQATVSRRLEKGVTELRTRLKKLGVVVPLALLSTLLSSNALASIIPSTLATSLGKMAIAGVGKGAVVATTSSIMSKTIATAVVCAMAITGGVIYKLNKHVSPAKELTLDLGNNVEMKLALIPAGEFMMGGKNYKRRVEITKPFYMGVYEVTQKQYQAVMGKNPSHFKGQSKPVEKVSWNDAQEFCKKLSRKTGKIVRLPTNAEWEYSCRAGTTGNYYDNLDDIAWYKQNSGKTTHPVGQKTSNNFGLYDMSGNVSEWCTDWYASTKKYHVIRGGSWRLDSVYCSSVLPGKNLPSDRYLTLGFRVIISTDVDIDNSKVEQKSSKEQSEVTPIAKAVNKKAIVVDLDNNISVPNDRKLPAHITLYRPLFDIILDAKTKDVCIGKELANGHAKFQYDPHGLNKGVHHLTVITRQPQPKGTVTIKTLLLPPNRLNVYLEYDDTLANQYIKIGGGKMEMLQTQYQKSKREFLKTKIGVTSDNIVFLPPSTTKGNISFNILLPVALEQTLMPAAKELALDIDNSKVEQKNKEMHTEIAHKTKVVNGKDKKIDSNDITNRNPYSPLFEIYFNAKPISVAVSHEFNTATVAAVADSISPEKGEVHYKVRVKQPKGLVTIKTSPLPPNSLSVYLEYDETLANQFIKIVGGQIETLQTQYQKSKREFLKTKFGVTSENAVFLPPSTTKGNISFNVALTSEKTPIISNKFIPATKKLTLDLGNNVEMKLALIPAGEFIMGGDGNYDGKPKHRVKITKPFHMGVFEVTQTQYQQVMGINPSHFKGANNPVEKVSWNDAVEFCKKLSLKTDRTVRLPTEAEWEYACRAGTTGKWYGTLTNIAWYKDNSGHKTHSVGQKQPNDFGLFDMSGNVWEWCSDWYDFKYYASSPTNDPTGPTSGSERVLRGGAWFFDGFLCHSAVRFRIAPSNLSTINGFRVVISVDAAN